MKGAAATARIGRRSVADGNVAPAVRLVMTLKVRDEGDVLDDNLRYHLAQGVDFFVATDNGSRDDTPDILRRYRDAGLLHLLEEPADDFRAAGQRWVTRMARLAATEFDADWVIHADADELWFPLTGTLRGVFASIPAHYSLLNAPRPEFAARPDGPGAWYERLVHREARSRLQHKVAHRASPEAVVGRGAHKVALSSGSTARHSGRAVLRALSPAQGASEQAPEVPAPRWPARILHFPLRSYEQFRRRVEVILFHGGYEDRPRHRELRSHHDAETLPQLYERLVVDDAELEARLADGSLVEDRCIREFLTDCPDPLAEPEAARRWAGERALRPDRSAAELAANELDMMHALDRADRSLRRQRRGANRRARKLEAERDELRRRLEDLERG
jgi:glycosyl transferase family 2